MNRRFFLLAALACGLAAPAGAVAAPFAPTRFSVRVQGAGPDVVLIPGLSAGSGVWASTVAALPGYRYHLIQVAGFAGAEARGNEAGPVLAPLAEEIARYIAERHLDRPAIVGHSMGGTLAMMIGARHPALAGRIMIVDMLPEPSGLFGGSAASWAPVSERLGAFFATPMGRRLFGTIVTSFTPPHAENRLSDPDVVARSMRELAVTDLRPELPRIRAPLTVVYAVPDRAARAPIDRQFAGAFANARGARLVRVDDSGHMVMLDQPARFQAALRTFLR